MSQLKGSRAGGVPCYSVFLDLQLTGLGPPTLGREICFNQSIEFSINLTQKHPQTHPDYLFKYLCSLWPSQVDIKLTITACIEHYNSFNCSYTVDILVLPRFFTTTNLLQEIIHTYTHTYTCAHVCICHYLCAHICIYTCKANFCVYFHRINSKTLILLSQRHAYFKKIKQILTNLFPKLLQQFRSISHFPRFKVINHCCLGILMSKTIFSFDLICIFYIAFIVPFAILFFLIFVLQWS